MSLPDHVAAELRSALGAEHVISGCTSAMG
jgi:hypothetical protein